MTLHDKPKLSTMLAPAPQPGYVVSAAYAEHRRLSKRLYKLKAYLETCTNPFGADLARDQIARIMARREALNERHPGKPNPRLAPELVQAIRTASGPLTDIARLHGISADTVSKIRRYERARHVA